MTKSPDAFRTISEVADWLGVQAHVLRFWESKFSQVKPIKRAGGRRYYRPNDMLLLGGIKKLLHDDGMTIKGAQKLLRENGTAFVADLSQPLDDLTVAVIEGTAEDVTDKIEVQQQAIEPVADGTDAAPVDAVSVEATDAGSETVQTKDAAPEPVQTRIDETDSDAVEASEDDIALPDAAQPVTIEQSEQEDAADPTSKRVDADEATEMPTFRAHARRDAASPAADGESSDGPPAQDARDATPVAPEKFEVSPPPPKAPPKPRIIDVGPLPELTDFPETPSILSSLAEIKSLSPENAAAIQPLLARLTRLRASMASPRKDIGKD